MNTFFQALELNTILRICLSQSVCKVKNCCSMTLEELTACSSVVKECPTTIRPDTPKFGHISLSSCNECRVGLCRLLSTLGVNVLQECVCTGHFRNQSSWHVTCANSHGSTWPLSAGQQDTSRGTKCKNIKDLPSGLPFTIGNFTTRNTTKPRGSIDKAASLGQKLSKLEKVGVVFGVLSLIASIAVCLGAAWKVPALKRRCRECILRVAFVLRIFGLHQKEHVPDPETDADSVNAGSAVENDDAGAPNADEQTTAAWKMSRADLISLVNSLSSFAAVVVAIVAVTKKQEIVIVS